MSDPIPLEDQVKVASIDAGVDRRPRIPEPLPVRLVAVEDVRMPALVGIEDQLDALYVGILQFERVPGELAYNSENYVLRFEIFDGRPVAHESLRAQGIEVRSLAEVEQKLIDAEIEYIRQRGVTP